MDKFEHLEAWCDEYRERTSIRILPHNAPMPLVVDQLMGNLKQAYKLIDSLTAQVFELAHQTNQLLEMIEQLNKKKEDKKPKKEVKK